MAACCSFPDNLALTQSPIIWRATISNRKLIRRYANVEAICLEAGTSIQHALKLTLYLQDLSDFAAVNQALEANLTAPYPARATTQVAGLPLGALIEIDAIVAVHGE